MNHTNRILPGLTFGFLLLLSTCLPAFGGKGDFIVDLLWKNSDEVIKPAVKAADSRLVEEAIRRHGDKAVSEAFERGGYAFLKQAREHGDEFVGAAVRVPGSEAILTTNPSFVLAAVRRHGDEALRLEKEVPGFLNASALRLADNDVKVLLKAAPEDRVYMAHLVKIADSPETARKMVSEYSKRGPGWLQKISKRNIVIGGVVTAAILDQAIRGENSIPSRALDRTSDAVLDLVKKILIPIAMIVGTFWILKLLFIKYLLKPLKHLFRTKNAPGEQARKIEEAK